LYLEVNDIERRATKVGSPHTDGFAGCFNRAALDEFFRPALKRKPYDSVEALQADLNLGILKHVFRLIIHMVVNLYRGQWDGISCCIIPVCEK